MNIDKHRPALPIDAHLDAMVASIKDHSSIIIKAEPGAGKTTRLPAALLSAVTQTIIVLQPRRLAAKLAAERVARELGESLGHTVGYKVRFEGRSSAATRLLFVTEGVFLRMLLDNPALTGVSAVVIDEFHERHIHTDLALAICRKLQSGLRQDLRLVVMSATLDPGPLETYLAPAQSFSISGRCFPVGVEYLPSPPTTKVEDAVVSAVARMLHDERCPGDILVFLNGMAEIRRCSGALQSLARAENLAVLPLSAELPGEAQEQVFASLSRRKVVLATNVAETSLTIPGITGVIDCGRAKEAGHAAWSGMPTLDIKKVSQASCIQRAGRAGRETSGVAYRLFAESDFYSRPAYAVPDIRRLDFTETMLELFALAAAWGKPITQVAEFLPWFELPQPRLLEASGSLLQLLGALDENQCLTPFGEKIAEVPLSPRLGAIVIRGLELGIGEAAALAAAILSERLLLPQNFTAVVHDDSDLSFQIRLYLAVKKRQPITPLSLAQAVSLRRVEMVNKVYTQLAQRFNLQHETKAAEASHQQLSAALLAGFPDRVARVKQKEGGRRDQDRGETFCHFCLGRGGILSQASVVQKAELIVALDATESTAKDAARATAVHAATVITPALLATYGAASLYQEKVSAVFVAAAGRVDVMKTRFYGQVVLSEERIPAAAEHTAMTEELLRQELEVVWPKPFDHDLALESYHERVRLLKEYGLEGEAYPVFEGEMFELFLAYLCEGKRSFKEITAQTLQSYIDDQLGYDEKQRLDGLTPLSIKTRAGRRLEVHYTRDRAPYLTGFIQDFFGMAASPQILAGRLPLAAELWAPNRRPVQVTSDLAGFWQSAYPALRAELSRRYPRHYWPENPSAAEPILLRTKRKEP